MLDKIDTTALNTIDDIRREALDGINAVGQAMMRPSVLYRPVLNKNGKSWTVTYNGFIAFGTTPALAMQNFDIAWYDRKAG